jgi:hypothetical protein
MTTATMEHVLQGQTRVMDFTFKRNVDGVLELLDPAIVQVSILITNPGSSIEDTVTYGGSEQRDRNLTRISAGVYRLTYILDVAGMWEVRSKGVDTVGQDSWPMKLTTPIRFIVDADPHQYTDTP